MKMQPGNKYDETGYPEFLTEMAELLAKRLTSDGVAIDRAATLGFDAAEFVREHFGGHQIYIPTGTKYECTRRDLEIFQQFTGHNTAQLADKHNLTEARIYQIIKRVLKAERERRQPDLFGDTKSAEH